MLRRRLGPKLVQNFLPMATAVWWFLPFFTDSLLPSFGFFWAVGRNADAAPEGKVTSDADASWEVEYLLTPCGPFSAWPVFAK